MKEQKKLKNKKAKLSYYGMKKALQKLGLSKEDYDWVRHHIHKIDVCPSEFLKHFIIKCIVCKILYDNNQRFLTEWEINGRYVDIFCIDNFIAYEIETTQNKNFAYNLSKRMQKYKYNFGVYAKSCGRSFVEGFTKKNIFVIYTKEIPDDLNEMYKELKKIINITLPDEPSQNGEEV